MKRLGIFIAVFLILLAQSLQGEGLIALKSYAPDARYYFYTGAPSGLDCTENITNGSGVIVSCDIRDAMRVRRSLKSIDGESVTFKGTDIGAVIAYLSARVEYTETVENILIYYCYSPLLSKGVDLSGKKVNMQIAYSNGLVSVGTPLLLGGY